jgi:DNA-binding SARP family transcriptional activator
VHTNLNGASRTYHGESIAMPSNRLAVRLLGPFEVSVDGRPVSLTAGRLRALLAMLAMSAGKVVSVDRLATAVWAEELPVNVRRSVQTYMTRLRSAVGAELIDTRATGYVLHAEPENVDALRFGRLLEAASTAPNSAVEQERLTEALALWRGRPFEGVPSEWLAESELPRLLEQHLTALERRLDLDIAAGRHGELVAELGELTALYPLRESLWARLLIVLDRCGRQAEALARYETVRVRIAEELGVDPGPELQRIHADLLAGRPPESDADPGTAGWPRMVPRQLPAAVNGFIGRDDVIAVLDELADDDGAGGARPTTICTIHGRPGVGKTALAVSWGHHAADRFPEGQLYIDLCGAGADRPPVDPGAALGRFLRALGVDARQIPYDVEERAALFRSATAGRRILVVLDNAATEEQVRPLVPGTATCLVLVTSRRPLTGLVAVEGAHSSPLGVFSPAMAMTLLESIVSPERIVAELDAAIALTRRCGYLPQALRTAAGKLVMRPDLEIEDLLRDLHCPPAWYA